MSMQELMRVTMTRDQIKEACIQWSEARVSIPNSSITVGGLPDDATALVIYTKKRAPRKAKGAA